MKLCALLIVALLAASASAETLNEWLAEQVRTDEQLLADSLSGVGGHSLSLLKDARTYVPFFLEAPKNFTFSSADQRKSFEAWIEKNRSGFLPGGYIYRLSFNAAPPLYATSAGEWSGTTWRSLALGREITLDPQHAWSGANGDYLYATLLSGVRPRLLVYDHRGEMKHQEVFDAATANFEQRLDAALKPYSQNSKPMMEMVSLAEYLKDQNAPWRAVDISGQFNLRTQQQRPDEQERLKKTIPLTRTTTISLLQPTQQSTPSPSQSAAPALMTPAPTAAPAASTQTPTPASQAPVAVVDQPSPVWPWLVGIVVLVVIVALALKRRA